MNKKLLYNRVLDFVKKAHGEQKRKYTGVPYWHHPLAVSNILKNNIPKCSIEIILASLLHDVVEDTPYTNKDIQNLFGAKVAKLVYWVTDISKEEDGNRTERKKIDREHLAKAPADAQSIKLADLINNTADICKNDPSFARTYMKEKKLLLQVLIKGNRKLYDIAKKQIEEYFDNL